MKSKQIKFPDCIYIYIVTLLSKIIIKKEIQMIIIVGIRQTRTNDCTVMVVMLQQYVKETALMIAEREDDFVVE